MAHSKKYGEAPDLYNKKAKLRLELKKNNRCSFCDLQKPENLIDLPSDSVYVHVYGLLYTLSTLEWYDKSKRCGLADLKKTLLTLRKQ